MAKRTDIHCPSNFVPGAYAYVTSFSFAHQVDGWPIPAVNVDYLVELRHTQRFFQGGAADGASNRCDVCGATYLHGDVWRHETSGEHITLGHQCADKFSMASERGDWSRMRATAINRAVRRARLMQNIDAARALLREDQDLAKAMTTRHGIIRDIVLRMLHGRGRLSEAQVALVKKIAREEAERAARRAEEEAEVKAEAPDGVRVRVSGTVLGTKWVDNDFGGALKMLVKVTSEDGSAWKCWGTAPDSICWVGIPGVGSQAAEVKGSVVEFTAAFQRSKDDAAFAFYKRPTKAVVIEHSPGDREKIDTMLRDVAEREKEKAS